MKFRRFLAGLLLLTSLASAEADLSRLTSLFHQGQYEQLVAEGEVLGKTLQGQGDKQAVARVYQMLTIAYMRLGRQEDMRRCNAIAKGIFAEENQNSSDPAARERAVAQKAASLYSSGELEQTISYVDQQLADWPAASTRRYWVFKPKFHALWAFRTQDAALQALQKESSTLEELLLSDPENAKYYRANLGLTYLLGASSLAYLDPVASKQLGLQAQKHLLGPEGCGVDWLSGGSSLPYRVAAGAGEYSSAIELSKRYLSSMGRDPHHQKFYFSSTQGRTAYWLDQLGQDREALELYLQTLTFLDGAWSSLKLRQNKQSLVSTTESGEFFPPPSLLFERAIALAVKLGDSSKALELSELFKSRSLRDSLSRQELEKLTPPGVPSELLQQERQLFRKLAASPEPETVANYLETLQELAQYDQEYADLLSGQPSKLALPQLEKGEVLVEYFSTREQLFLFVLRPDGSIGATQHPIAQSTLNRQVSRARKSIKRLSSERSLKKKLQALSKALIAPIEGELEKAERVIFVPHGDLHYLPFSSLLTSDGRYLIERFEIVEAPSAHSLTFSQRKNPRRRKGFQASQFQSRVFALGDQEVQGWSPLPGTAEEAATIESLLPQTQSFVAAELQQQQVLDNLSRGDLLHFATHGFLDHDNPLRSGLLTSDRPVTVSDILQSRLEAYSVFLSACDTAMGEQTGADEIVGLQQSFLYAGTPSVIASLWQISDEATAELVSSYYKLIRTEPKGSSLRKAQLEMLQSPKHSHPYFWSAFILSGDWI